VSGDIDMDKIYQKVNKKYRQDSPKWNRAVEREIDRERERLGLRINKVKDELVKEKFPEEEIKTEESEEEKEE
jgi:hypothetical protein